jgi:hypothetical protein
VRTKLKVEAQVIGYSHREEQGDKHTRSGAEGNCQLEVDESGERKAPNAGCWRKSVRGPGFSAKVACLSLGSGTTTRVLSNAPTERSS